MPSLRELLLKIEASFDEEQRQMQSSGQLTRPPTFFPRSLSDAAPLSGNQLPLPTRGPSSASNTTGSSSSWIERHPLYKAFQEDPMLNLRPTNSPLKMADSAKSCDDEDSDPSEGTMRSQTSTVSLSPSLSSSSHSSSSSTLRRRDPVPRRYLCTVCDKTFTRPSTLKTHMNSVSSLTTLCQLSE